MDAKERLAAPVWEGGTTEAVAAAVAQAEELGRRFEFSAALDLLEETDKQHPNSADVASEAGAIYLKAEDPQRAAERFAQALKIQASSPAAQLGLASVDCMNREYDAAERRTRIVLVTPALNDSQRLRAHLVLARTLLERGKNQEAEAEAERALSLDRSDSDSLYTLAFLKAADRQAAQARELAAKAIAADPYNIGALRLLSQYLNGRKGDSQEARHEAVSSYRLGKELEIAGRPEEAIKQFENALQVEPGYYRALLSLSAVCLRSGNYQTAAGWAARALRVDPASSLAHLHLALAYTGLKEQASEQVGAPDYAARYFSRPEPPIVPSMIEKVFPEYARLSHREQLVIEYSVAGLARFLPVLSERGAKVRLVPLDVRVTDYSGYEGGSVERTFDGRYYASIRGVGGHITLCGIESIGEAARSGFNSIAHEFAHEVQRVAFTAEQRARLRALYQDAVENRRTLDYYSAADDYEYFAVGYEAFVSEFKRPSLGITARHTRDDLRRKDPALYEFIAALETSQAAR